MELNELYHLCKQKLEANGFKESIAGDDWPLCVRCYVSAIKKHKGLFCYGLPGCGKTTYLRAIQKAYPYSTWWFSCISRKDMEKLNDMLVDEYYRAKLVERDIYLDDVAAENDIKSFGNQSNPVLELIDLLYEAQMRGAWQSRLFVSTNLLDAEAMHGYFGARIADRLTALCIPIRFRSETKRKWEKPCKI